MWGETAAIGDMQRRGIGNGSVSGLCKRQYGEFRQIDVVEVKGGAGGKVPMKLSSISRIVVTP